ncbi:MAG: methyltransferase domain-containing protein [Acidobacteriota bacterium]
MTDPTFRAFHDFEHAGWQKASEHYSGTFGALTAQTTGPLLEAVFNRPGIRLLDVACGPGYVAGVAAAQGADTIGLDFSPSMVREARGRYPDLAFCEGDAEELPFEAGRFDAAVMNFGLLHLARPEAAIAEAHRVLKPGGRHAFTVWARPEQAIGFGVVLRAMETHGNTDVGLPDGPPFFRFSEPEACRSALLHAGFVQPEVRLLPLIWRLPSADALFQAALCGGVRTSAAMQAQTPAALTAIRRAVHESLQQYADGPTIALPMAVVLASAGKPGI